MGRGKQAYVLESVARIPLGLRNNARSIPSTCSRSSGVEVHTRFGRTLGKNCGALGLRGPVAYEAPPALAEDFPSAQQVLRHALHSNASTSFEIELLRLLVRAGFGQEAEKFASVRGIASHVKQSPGWSSIAVYFQFRSAVESLTLAHYRSLAQGKDESEAYKAEITKLIDTTADDLSPHVGPDGPPSRETLRANGACTGPSALREAT